jgi:hypothetical protein
VLRGRAGPEPTGKNPRRHLGRPQRPLLQGTTGSRYRTRFPDRPFIRPQGEVFPGVSFGYFRYYVTNSRPSMLTQLQRCLRHYHARGQVLAPGRPVVDFVADEVTATPD